MAQSTSIYEDSAVIPPNAAYVGTADGGQFIVLERRDIPSDDGNAQVGFYMQVFYAWSTGGPYGRERIGDLAFEGNTVYVPPPGLPPDLQVPTVDYILGTTDGDANSSFEDGVLSIRMPETHGSQSKWISRLVPF